MTANSNSVNLGLNQMNRFLIVLLSSLMFSSCGQKPTIIGHWRRLDMAEKYTTTTPGRLFGDLILADDSTFTMVGNDSVQVSNTPGWHLGGTMRGKWNLEGKSLNLFIDDVRIPLTMNISLLTKSDLQFRSQFANSPLFRYKRVN